MTTKEPKSKQRRNPPPLIRDLHPLLRTLVAEATRREDTLALLAQQLGVTYERLAQWRRGESDISNAHRSVHEGAAKYLGIPTVLVLLMAGAIDIEDFVWPDESSLSDRVARELERLRQDPYIGSVVPPELASASPAVKLFVVFLYRELHGDTGQGSQGKRAYRWLTALNQAAAGNIRGQLDLETLREEAKERTDIF